MNPKTAVERALSAFQLWRPAFLGGLAIALAWPCAWARAEDSAPPVLTLLSAQSGGGQLDEQNCNPDWYEESVPSLPSAAGQRWSARIEARSDGDAALLWALVKAPSGLVLIKAEPVKRAGAGRVERATLRWTPTAGERADNDVLVRVTGSGGAALCSFNLTVEGANHVPVIDGIETPELTEGQTLRLPITASDADGDELTITLRNLPPGARYDAARGLLTWTPGYGQAGEYKNIAIAASDGKHTATERFSLTVQRDEIKLAVTTLPDATKALKAHAGLTTSHALNAIDSEGRAQFWRVTGATHGAARMAGDGITLLFTPEAGYAGQASVTVQPDRSHAPIELAVNISAARLLALHLPPELLAPQRLGSTLTVRATADFEDEANVPIDEPGGYLRLEAADLAGMGYVGAQAIKLDAATGRVRFAAPGAALLVATWQNADGRSLSAVAALTAVIGYEREDDWPPAIQPVHVDPAALTLPPGGERQLKVEGNDLNSGRLIDIHAASQTVFEGAPARVEEAEGPDGKPVQIKHDARPAVYSGTRYFSGDERIATVSADGLVTAHAPGKVTISIVHLRSLSFDGEGTLLRQIVGQRNVALTVTPAQRLDGAAAIDVRQAEGGVIVAPTGETVLIGPGALAQDSAVGIRRIALADLASAAGIAAPADGLLQPLGAFHLDAGAQPSAAPLQLAIPVQSGIATQPGEEALFLRKGRVLLEGGKRRDTWWLVDSGLIGADGVARTASSPYGGVIWPGDYVVMRRAPNVAGKPMSVSIEAGGWLDFGAMNLSLAGGTAGAPIHSETLGALATAAADLRAGRHQFGVTQTVRVTLPPETPGQGIALDVRRQLPQAPYPRGTVSYPQFAKGADAVSYDEASNTVNIKLAMTDTGPFTGTVILGIRSWFADGKNREIARFDGATLGDTLSITPPPDLALGNSRWQLVREIAVEQIDHSGELRATQKPLTFGSGNARLEIPEPAPALVAGLTCTGVRFMRENKVVREIKLLDAPPGGQCFTAAGAQPMTASVWSLLYVGGAGKIYVIDLVKLQLIDTLVIPDGRNITSLAIKGSLLLIGEGDSAGAGGFRLLAMFSDPQSGNYHRNPVALKLPQLAASPLGVGGMEMGADGRTLVITASKPQAGGGAASGEVWALDLNSVDLKTGAIDPPVIAQGADGLAAPLTVATARRGNPDNYLVRSASGPQATLLLKRDASRKITEATLQGIDASQPESATGANDPKRPVLTMPEDVKFAIFWRDTRRSTWILACPCVQGRCVCGY